MAVLLAILAMLQYRWLGEVSQAEKERMLARMQSSAMRFARDFDREVTRAFSLLDPAGPPRARGGTHAERSARWKASALYPDLVRAVFVAEPAAEGALRLSRVEDDTGRLLPVDWPKELAGLRARLEDPGALAGWSPASRRGRPLPLVDADSPALVVPIVSVVTLNLIVFSVSDGPSGMLQTLLCALGYILCFALMAALALQFGGPALRAQLDFIRTVFSKKTSTF